MRKKEGLNVLLAPDTSNNKFLSSCYTVAETWGVVKEIRNKLDPFPFRIFQLNLIKMVQELDTGIKKRDYIIYTYR